MHKIGIVRFLLVALVLLSGCAPNTTPPQPLPPPVAPPQEPAPPAPVPPAPAPVPTPSPAPPAPAPPPKPEPTPSEELGPSPEPEPQPLPINIRLDYIGVKCAHGGNVQLVVVIGDKDNMEKYLFPPIEKGYPMGDYETKKISQEVFHAASVKGSLKMSVLAYHRDQSKTEYLALIKMMEWYYGDSINMLKQLVLNMPENDELIGHYEKIWSEDELRSIEQYKQYDEVGIDDLQLWFSIWSDIEPPPPSEPSLSPEKFKVFLAGYPLFYTGKLYFEGEMSTGDTINISVRQIPPYDNKVWRNWGVLISDPQEKTVASITEKELTSCSLSHTAKSDGFYIITIWNSGYAFNAEVQFEPKEWNCIGNNGHGSRVIYCN